MKNKKNRKKRRKRRIRRDRHKKRLWSNRVSSWKTNDNFIPPSLTCSVAVKTVIINKQQQRPCARACDRFRFADGPINLNPALGQTNRRGWFHHLEDALWWECLSTARPFRSSYRQTASAMSLYSFDGGVLRQTDQPTSIRLSCMEERRRNRLQQVCVPL